MTEIEKLRRAKKFIEKLADGYDPLTDQIVPEGDVINNVQISRCLFFVADVLAQVIEQSDDEQKCIPGLENQGKPWDAEQEEMLMRLFRSRYTISEIAEQMGRTKGGIESRLKKLDLIDR